MCITMIVKRTTEIHRNEELGNRSPKLGKRLRTSLYALCMGTMLLLPSQSFASTDLLQGVTPTSPFSGLSNPYGSTDKNDSTSTDIPSSVQVFYFTLGNSLTYNFSNPVNISSYRLKVNYSTLINYITFYDINGNQIGTRYTPIPMIMCWRD